MKWIKYISHPHAYIVFFICVSCLAFIPNGLGWRGDMLGFTKDYFDIYVLFILFYFIGYYSVKGKQVNEIRKIEINEINLFHFIFLISLSFFLLKFIYISGIPLFSDSPYLRIRMSKLGGFVDFPTKAMSLLGIIGYYFYILKRNYLYLFQFFISILLNFLFAERSLIVFTLVGAILLYVNFHQIGIRTIRKVLIAGVLVLFLIGWVQILRHGGKQQLDKSGQKSTLEVATWVVHGDLTGSQKFGAYIVNELGEERLKGRYTLGIYLSLFIPNYKEHGASYLQENYTKSKTAQSAAIPYSYFMDFGYWSLIFPLIIGGVSRLAYDKFRSLNSPFYTIFYLAFYYNLIWSVRAGNFPVDPKLLYFTLILLFIFNIRLQKTINREMINLLRIMFLLTLALSFLALIIRW